MKKLALLALLFCVTSANAAFLELNDAQEFQNLIQTAKVPVVVQFAAYWCGPCQNLRATFKQVAQDYNDDQVRLAYVDAYTNKSLASYLQGGYPTVRTFLNGQLTEPAFLGSQSASYVKNFIDNLIQGRDDSQRIEDQLAGPTCPLTEVF